MRIAVMGAGAIGLLYGGWLQQAGADVTFLARGKRLADLRGSPLTAEGQLPFTLDRVQVAGGPNDIEPVDAILLCVKLYDLRSAATLALPALKPDGTLIAIQNGVNVYDTLKSLLPSERIAVGPVYSVAKLTHPTTVFNGGLARVVVGNPECDVAPLAQAVVDIWKKAGVDASISKDIATALWMKFVGVATGSALHCLTRLPAGILYHDETLKTYVRQSIDEVMAVGRAVGVKFPNDMADNLLAYLANFPPDGVASMRLDLDAGRKLELDGLSGEVTRLGRLHGVPTPLHDMAFAMLAPFRDGPVKVPTIGVYYSSE
jgi:2-dehydropantoate 2-reductase